MEGLLRSIDENHGRRSATHQLLVLMLALGVVSCQSANPSVPDQPQGPYLGTWSGMVTSDVIGPGSGTVVLDGGIKAAGGPLLTGHWSFVFNDARFNASGAVSGGWLPDRSVFVLLFSSSVVPCPAEAGGVSERTRGASLTLTANRMQGSYIAGGCPGGTMDLTRK
jgi:hypothetical protein